MNKITLKNFRCFRDEQTVRLAPLTLLIGENSTGKTSFMSMIRALWDIAYRNRIPDFKEDPYDLGSFDEIAHHRGSRGGKADNFEAGFDSTTRVGISEGTDTPPINQPYHFDVTFAKDGTAPVPVRRYISREKQWIEEHWKTEEQEWQICVGTERGSWKYQFDSDTPSQFDSDIFNPLDMTHYMIRPLFYSIVDAQKGFVPSRGPKKISTEDIRQLNNLCYTCLEYPTLSVRPYASAPVRSKPRRTYDPTRLSTDPEGDYVPMYLASMYLRHKNMWKTLKNNLENFGKVSGLFDEISIVPLGKRDSGPFQIRVKKFGNRLKGPQRNLVDVGYGISQALPMVTELLRRDGPPLVLLQQPEVHLHPSAQAALGSLFCEVAAKGQQLLIETHSDYILDRVRMDIRDKKVSLNPDDVSILFFERQELDVCIHSLRLDKEGNILNAPANYRSFFLKEIQRSLGL